MGCFNEKSYNNEYLHYSKFNYLNIPKKEYTGDIIKDINKAKIYEFALDKSIDLTINYFNEIKKLSKRKTK